MILLDILAHHSEPGDPVLLAWIQDVITTIFGSGPAIVVASLGFVIVAFPIVILAVYLFSRIRQGSDNEASELQELPDREDSRSFD